MHELSLLLETLNREPGLQLSKQRLSENKPMYSGSEILGNLTIQYTGVDTTRHYIMQIFVAHPIGSG